MPRLSEVLGGIAKDVTQAQITADLVSLTYLESYQSDDLLKLMPTPRVRISDVRLELRFGISTTAAKPTSTGAFDVASQAWSSQLFELTPTLLMKTIRNASAADKKAILAAAEKVEPRKFDSKGLLDGKLPANAKASENFVADVVKRLPRSIRTRMPTLRQTRSLVNRALRSELQIAAPRLKKIADAKSAGEFDLELLVTDEELQDIDESRIHTISLTLDIDDSPIETG